MISLSSLKTYFHLQLFFVNQILTTNEATKLNDLICLNFLEEIWRVLFCVLFFRLLSSSLLLLVVAQYFDCCNLRPSSDVPCLSTVKLYKWFPRLNHFHTQINKGHLKKARGYSSQNVVLQLTTIKMMTNSLKNSIQNIKWPYITISRECLVRIALTTKIMYYKTELAVYICLWPSWLRL